MQAGIQAYQSVSVSTMDRGAILLALYEGAINFLKQAIAAHERQDIERFCHFLGRSEKIIGELMGSVDPEPLPLLATRLQRIYDFMLFELTEANLNRTIAPINQVIRLLGQVSKTYGQVILSPTDEVASILAIPTKAKR